MLLAPSIIKAASEPAPSVAIFPHPLPTVREPGIERHGKPTSASIIDVLGRMVATLDRRRERGGVIADEGGVFFVMA
jgi:hypothetical protein